MDETQTPAPLSPTDPAEPTSPKILLDETFHKAHDVVEAVKALQKQQEDADRKVNKEIRAHAETKHKIKAMESEQIQARETIELEVQSHFQTKEKLLKEDRAHTKTKDALQAAKDDVSSMRLQMDAMKVEMEAQRKAFVINVNWAARCTELKTKFDQSCHEYDQLLEQHVKAKGDMDNALRSQEEFRMKHQAAADSYGAAQADMERHQKELDAKNEFALQVETRLAELQVWKERQERDAIQKKLGSQQALSVMQRSLAKGDLGILTSAMTGWSTLTSTEKKRRIQKDKAMKNAAKTIADSGTALCAEVFGEWRDETRRNKMAALRAAERRLQEQSAKAGGGDMEGRSRALKQLEKQFKGEDKALMQEVFHGWALGQVARKKKEQNHKKASRMIANSAKGALAETFGVWNDLTQKKRDKDRKQAANMKNAGRMIANKDRFLMQDCYQYWWGYCEERRRKRKIDEVGTAKAMKMLANSQAAIMNLIFDSWMKMYKQSKKKSAGNKKALRMIAGSNEALLRSVWKGWTGATDNKKAKEGATAKAVRMINNSAEALQVTVFRTWGNYCMKNKDKNKKIRALEKSFGAEDKGIKMVVMSAWQNFAMVEGRKKKQKDRSMRSAIKSITGNQDLLRCHMFLAWARFGSIVKGEEKKGAEVKAIQDSLTSAVEEARINVEHLLVYKQEEVVRVREDLETKKREKEEYGGRMDGLNSQLEKAEQEFIEKDKQVASLAKELDESRRRALDIGKELGKVGIYVSQTPRKNSRGGSGSRPRSGQKSSDDKLPPISGSNSRPDSGSKYDGSKSARGVAGERGGSARNAGRPPRAEDGQERRFLIDGSGQTSGPFTYQQFEEIYGDKSREAWNASTPEYYVPDSGYGAYGDY